MSVTYSKSQREMVSTQGTGAGLVVQAAERPLAAPAQPLSACLGTSAAPASCLASNQRDSGKLQVPAWTQLPAIHTDTGGSPPPDVSWPAQVPAGRESQRCHSLPFLKKHKNN